MLNLNTNPTSVWLLSFFYRVLQFFIVFELSLKFCMFWYKHKFFCIFILIVRVCSFERILLALKQNVLITVQPNKTTFLKFFL